jgi:hypothetical protein
MYELQSTESEGAVSWLESPTANCRNCVKRNQECIYTKQPKQSHTVASSHQPNPKIPPESPPSPYDELVPINTEHMRLLHHFETFTSHTFIFQPENWKQAIIKLALQVRQRSILLFHPILIQQSPQVFASCPVLTSHRTSSSCMRSSL